MHKDFYFVKPVSEDEHCSVLMESVDLSSALEQFKICDSQTYIDDQHQDAEDELCFSGGGLTTEEFDKELGELGCSKVDTYDGWTIWEWVRPVDQAGEDLYIGCLVEKPGRTGGRVEACLPNGRVEIMWDDESTSNELASDLKVIDI